MLQNLFLTDCDSSSYGKGIMLEALCKQHGPGPPAARPGFHINRLQTLELTDGTRLSALGSKNLGLSNRQSTFWRVSHSFMVSFGSLVRKIEGKGEEGNGR